MSNTGRNKKLASFNCDSKLWTDFVKQCQQKGTTATATLTRFISLYINGSLDNLDVLPSNAFDDQFKERVREAIDEYLAKERDKWAILQSTVSALSKKVEELESLGNTKKSTKKREFWFIKERAKHLGISVSAAQLIHIEMFANDSYKKRYGKLPDMQLYRNIQAYAYPEQSVDLLDAAIKKVVEM